VDESLTAGRESLIIASQTPETDQPAKGTLNLPTVTLDLKASLWFGNFDRFSVDEFPIALRATVSFGNNFGLPMEVLFDPGDERPSISTVSEQM
jgi:hypothetical protein